MTEQVWAFLGIVVATIGGVAGTWVTARAGGPKAPGSHAEQEAAQEAEVDEVEASNNQAILAWQAHNENLMRRLVALETAQAQQATETDQLRDRVTTLEAVVARLRSWRERAMAYIHLLREQLGDAAPPIPSDLDYTDED